jgi:hypothetical protein
LVGRPIGGTSLRVVDVDQRADGALAATVIDQDQAITLGRDFEPLLA